MPAGDGATITKSVSCDWCDVDLGEFTVEVDTWAAYACPDCADKAKKKAPDEVTVYVLEPADD